MADTGVIYVDNATPDTFTTDVSYLNATLKPGSNVMYSGSIESLFGLRKISPGSSVYYCLSTGCTQGMISVSNAADAGFNMANPLELTGMSNFEGQPLAHSFVIVAAEQGGPCTELDSSAAVCDAAQTPTYIISLSS